VSEKQRKVTFDAEIHPEKQHIPPNLQFAHLPSIVSIENYSNVDDASYYSQRSILKNSPERCDFITNYFIDIPPPQTENLLCLDILEEETVFKPNSPNKLKLESINREFNNNFEDIFEEELVEDCIEDTPLTCETLEDRVSFETCDIFASYNDNLPVVPDIINGEYIDDLSVEEEVLHNLGDQDFITNDYIDEVLEVIDSVEFTTEEEFVSHKSDVLLNSENAYEHNLDPNELKEDPVNESWIDTKELSPEVDFKNHTSQDQTDDIFIKEKSEVILELNPISSISILEDLDQDNFKELVSCEDTFQNSDSKYENNLSENISEHNNDNSSPSTTECLRKTSESLLYTNSILKDIISAGNRKLSRETFNIDINNNHNVDINNNKNLNVDINNNLNVDINNNLNVDINNYLNVDLNNNLNVDLNNNSCVDINNNVQDHSLHNSLQRKTASIVIPVDISRTANDTEHVSRKISDNNQEINENTSDHKRHRHKYDKKRHSRKDVSSRKHSHSKKPKVDIEQEDTPLSRYELKSAEAKLKFQIFQRKMSANAGIENQNLNYAGEPDNLEPHMRDFQKESQILIWIYNMIDEAARVDFEFFLKDGCILCKLMNRIVPGCIPEEEITWEGPRSKQKNIANFLREAESYGVPKARLFFPQDLLQLRNLPRVTRCIYALAKVVQEDTAMDADTPSLGDEPSFMKEVNKTIMIPGHRDTKDVMNQLITSTTTTTSEETTKRNKHSLYQ